jgi:hypothetical protein
MSSTVESSELDMAGIFADTSILLNFGLRQDSGEASEILETHESENITGRTVE